MHDTTGRTVAVSRTPLGRTDSYSQGGLQTGRDDRIARRENRRFAGHAAFLLTPTQPRNGTLRTEAWISYSKLSRNDHWLRRHQNRTQRAAFAESSGILSNGSSTHCAIFRACWEVVLGAGQRQGERWLSARSPQIPMPAKTHGLGGPGRLGKRHGGPVLAVRHSLPIGGTRGWGFRWDWRAAWDWGTAFELEKNSLHPPCMDWRLGYIK